MRCRWTSRLLRIFFGRAVDVAYEAFRVPVTNATPDGPKKFPWRWTLDPVPGCIRPASSNRSPRRRGCRSRQDHNLGNCPCRPNDARAVVHAPMSTDSRLTRSPSELTHQGGRIASRWGRIKHKLHTRKFAKIASARIQPPGASMPTHGWVRTVRTAQNLHNTDIQWAECDVEAVHGTTRIIAGTAVLRYKLVQARTVVPTVPPPRTPCRLPSSR